MNDLKNIYSKLQNMAYDETNSRKANYLYIAINAIAAVFGWSDKVCLKYINMHIDNIKRGK
jgi:hypothetical protein